MSLDKPIEWFPGWVTPNTATTNQIQECCGDTTTDDTAYEMHQLLIQSEWADTQIREIPENDWLEMLEKAWQEEE